MKQTCSYPYCENKVKQKKTKKGKTVFTKYCTKHMKNKITAYVS